VDSTLDTDGAVRLSNTPADLASTLAGRKAIASELKSAADKFAKRFRNPKVTYGKVKVGLDDKGLPVFRIKATGRRLPIRVTVDRTNALGFSGPAFGGGHLILMSKLSLAALKTAVRQGVLQRPQE
jgi:hypothetical protein